jgi:hypothetical protein
MPPIGWQADLAVVGERGPTLVNLPRGSRVRPNNIRVSSRIFEPAPSIAADALETFNRASHPDALPEMQLVPAETLQPDTDEQPVITLRFGLGLLALSLAMIGVHWVWSAGL